MNVLAIIPARRGSKGIPRKNLVPLAGRPLIQYTVDVALSCSLINKVFLSTDCEEVKNFCQTIGLESDYLRPDYLAQDGSTQFEVVVDALNHLEKQNYIPDAILLLQPTSPLRTVDHLNEAIEQFKSSQTHSLISINNMFEHPFECVDGSQEPWKILAKADKKTLGRQDYRQGFGFINGSLYICQREWFLKEKRFFQEGQTALYRMDEVYGVDVDTYLDLYRAEGHLKYLEKEGKK